MWLQLVVWVGILAESWAWWCTGHMLVAQIAQTDLQENDPAALAWAQGLVANLAGSLTHGTSDTFVESACWPDDIKVFNLQAMNDWHYVDQPYNPDGMMNIIEYSNGNALWAIQQFEATLTSPNRDEAPLETSIAMRYLLHLIGDMHQPLHVTELFSGVFPLGDQGGNLFPIVFDTQIIELHALWDACMGRYEEDPVRPLNTTFATFLETEADALMTQYTRTNLAVPLSDPNITDWATANYHLAVTYAYNITYGGRPSQNYLDVSWDVIQKQLALAGYRLSDLIQMVYGNIQAIAS